MMCSRFVQARLLRQLSLLCAIGIVAPSLAHAQESHAVSGTVTDPAQTPLYGATVEIAGTELRGRTDEHGEFRITGIGSGALDLKVRRLGFAPVSLAVRVTPNQEPDPLNIVLPALPTTVKPVVVEASRVGYSGRLADYYERLHRRSNGVFVPREEIDRRSNRTLTQLLSSTPGVSGVRLKMGGAVRMRGQTCRPLVWLDGVPLPAGEVDLDAFPVNTLQGIELYLGSSSAPMAYTALQGASGCGTILLWSRGRDTDVQSAPARRSVDLERLAASQTVYTADQVDKEAQLAGEPLAVEYPPALFASGVKGSAVAEFVVDPDGTIERDSFEIFFASHPLFGEAATAALAGARYTPALKNGVAVRQLVQQPFTFSGGAVHTSASRQD